MYTWAPLGLCAWITVSAVAANACHSGGILSSTTFFHDNLPFIQVCPSMKNVHCTSYNAHYNVYTVHCTKCSLCTLSSKLYTLYIMNIVNYKTAWYKLYNAYWTLLFYFFSCFFYKICCLLYTVHRTLYNVRLYTMHRTISRCNINLATHVYRASNIHVLLPWPRYFLFFCLIGKTEVLIKNLALSFHQIRPVGSEAVVGCRLICIFVAHVNTF